MIFVFLSCLLRGRLLSFQKGQYGYRKNAKLDAVFAFVEKILKKYNKAFGMINEGIVEYLTVWYLRENVPLKGAGSHDVSNPSVKTWHE
jgi:hypothetical protein